MVLIFTRLREKIRNLLYSSIIKLAAIIQDRRNENNNDNNISIHYDNKLWTNDCSIC